MNNEILFFLIVFWTLPWKGVALWYAARDDKKIWFIALLVLQTIGILEIIYIFLFHPRFKRQSPISSASHKF